MVHVLLLILKIIGFTILGLIGLVLALVLIVLLVPLRYHVQVEHGNELKVNGTGSWLLHIIHAKVTYLDDQLKIWVKVLGFTIYDKDNPPKPKKGGKGKGFLGKIKRARKDSKNKDRTKAHSIKIDSAKIDNIKIDSINKDIVNKDIASRDIVIKDSASKDIVSKDIVSKDSVNKDNIKLDGVELNSPQKENIKVESLKGESSKHEGKKESSKFEITHKIETDQKVEESKESHSNSQEEYQETRNNSKQGFFGKVKNIFNEIKNIKMKIKNIWDGLKERIKKMYQATINIDRIKHLILDFFNDKANREGIKITLLSVKKLLKHILPTKIKSRVIFGTGDPCSTGQALSAIGILYSMYGDKIRITPDFNEKRFEGQHDIKGRIRILTLVILVLKLLLDKRWKELRRNLNTLKEAL